MVKNINNLYATFSCVDNSISVKGTYQYKNGGTTVTRSTKWLTLNKSETLYLPNIPFYNNLTIKIYVRDTGSTNEVLVYSGLLWGAPYVPTGFSMMGTSSNPAMAIYPIPSCNVQISTFM